MLLWDRLKGRRKKRQQTSSENTRVVSNNSWSKTTWINELLKSSGWRPDGSQTNTAALVVVSTPHWTPALMKRFPQTRAAPSLHFPSCVCAFVVDAFDHTTPNPEVLYVGRSMLIIDLGFYSLKPWGRTYICLLVFSSDTHPTWSPAGYTHTVHQQHAYSRRCGKFCKYNLDDTGLDAFGCKSSIPAASRLLFVMLPEKIVGATFHTLHSTSWGDWSYSSSLTS